MLDRFLVRVLSGRYKLFRSVGSKSEAQVQSRVGQVPSGTSKADSDGCMYELFHEDILLDDQTKRRDNVCSLDSVFV